MDWIARLAERRIIEAREEGVFNDLPGRGKPLPPDPFARLRPELRMAARVLANSGYAPEEVGLLREMNDARRSIGLAETAEERERLIRDFVRAELKFNMAMERNGKLYG